jgi:hypothetical protein
VVDPPHGAVRIPTGQRHLGRADAAGANHVRLRHRHLGADPSYHHRASALRIR